MSEQPQIVITDMLNDLSCYHFSYCDDVTPEHIKNVRGVIKNNLGETVCTSFKYTPDYIEKEEILNDPILNTSFKVFKSYEGTILRVFYYKEWYISTHRKIDAFKSKWSSDKSFGEIFLELLNYSSKEEFDKWCDEHLNKDLIYSFLLSTSVDNRIVCKNDNKELYCVGLHKKDGTFSFYDNSINDERVKCMEEVQLTNINDIYEYANNLSYKNYTGVILINDKGDSAKIANTEYYKYFLLRINSPSVIFRFIQLKYELKESEEVLESFTKIYEEYDFNRIHSVLEDICVNIYKKYRNRFVRKMVSIAPPEQYYIMKEIHEDFLKNKTVTSLEKVKSYIYSSPTNKIYNLYNAYVNREKVTGNGNKLPEEYKNKVFSTIF